MEANQYNTGRYAVIGHTEVSSPGLGISYGYMPDAQVAWHPASHGSGNPVMALHAALERVTDRAPRTIGGSWSATRWQDNLRSPSRWLSTRAIIADIDHFDADGQHVAPKHPSLRPRLVTLARTEGLGIVHDTPRGMRVRPPMPVPLSSATWKERPPSSS